MACVNCDFLPMKRIKSHKLRCAKTHSHLEQGIRGSAPTQHQLQGNMDYTWGTLHYLNIFRLS